jgi:hypothetical protein
MKDDGWKELEMMWVGGNPEFNAVSERNRRNRGKEGTHVQGNRNHDRYKEHLVYIYALNNLSSFFLMFLLYAHNICT